jgi:hypothetical protein
MLLALLVLSPADATVSPDTQDAILSLLQYVALEYLTCWFKTEQLGCIFVYAGTYTCQI